MHIVISSGHRQAAVLAYDEHVSLATDGGHLIALSSTMHNLNLHAFSLDSLESVVEDLLEKLRAKLCPDLQNRQFGDHDRLVAVLPGISTPHDLRMAEGYITRANNWKASQSVKNFHVIDDTYAALVAGAHSTTGISAIAGTGASVYFGSADNDTVAFVPGRPRKLDGWGPLLGDHGSGFRLAVNCLERLCQLLDNPEINANTPFGLPPLYWNLAQALLDTQSPKTGDRGIQNCIDDLMSNRSPDWRFRVAELAIIVTKAANEGDIDAQRAVKDAAKALAVTIRTGLRNPIFSDHRSSIIHCTGGMFCHSRDFLNLVKQSLNDEHFHNDLALSVFRPCFGALLISMSHNWTNPSPDSLRNAIDAAHALPKDMKEIVFNCNCISDTGASQSS